MQRLILMKRFWLPLLFGLTSVVATTQNTTAGSIRGPITFGPDARIRLDCPPMATQYNAVQSEVTAFGHVNKPVKFKLIYRPTLTSSEQTVAYSERVEKDYVQTLNTFLGNFPGPGYYGIVMRNTNSFAVSIPANEEIGIICH